MKENGRDRLQSLLFGEEGSTLVNVKFFPGNGRGLTAEVLSEAGYNFIATAQQAWRDRVPSRPPVTGREKRQLLA